MAVAAQHAAIAAHFIAAMAAAAAAVLFSSLLLLWPKRAAAAWVKLLAAVSICAAPRATALVMTLSSSTSISSCCCCCCWWCCCSTIDPEKLQVARIGSEFPYSKAIPFDAEKLQVARERSVYPFWKQVLYRPENNYQLRDGDYSDESSYENNLLYPKKSHHSRKLLSAHSKHQASSISHGNKLASDNWEREEKTSVLRKEFNYRNKPSKLGRKRETSRRHIRSILRVCRTL